MKIIHLIIDTNTLISEPYYKKSEYNSLEILSKKGHIKLYLPYIVENEYMRFLKGKYSNIFKTIEGELKKIENINTLFNITSFGKVSQDIKKLKIDIEDNIKKDFTYNFCVKLNVEKLKIEPHHADKVFDKYFNYILPFKEDNKDIRKDIPDAFILECVIDIKNNNNDNVIMITSDENVQNTCEKNGIVVFKSIKDFIESDDIQNILTEQQSFEEFIEYLKSESSIENYLKSYYIKELEYSEIKDEIIPSDDNSGIIEGIGYPENIICNFYDLINYGNRTIGIPVFFNINANVEFPVYKADYYMLIEEGEYDELSPNERNKHYFEIHKDFLLNINGTVIIDISNINLYNNKDIFDKSIKIEINNFQIMKTINTNEKGIKYFNMCLSIANPYSNAYINNYDLSKNNFNLFINQSSNTAYNNLFVLIFLHIRKLRKYIFDYIINKSQVSGSYQSYIGVIYKNRSIYMDTSNQYPIAVLFDYANKNNINLNTSLNKFYNFIKEAELYINHINIIANEVFKYNYAVLHCIKYELFDDVNDFDSAFNELKELIDADSKIELSYRYFISIIETKLKRLGHTNIDLVSHIQYADKKLETNLNNGTILLLGDFYHSNNRILCANYNI